LESTYRVNYKSYKCPIAQLHPNYTYQPNNAKFYDSTEYKEQYVPNKNIVDRPTYSEYQYIPSKARFEGKTTYG